MFIEIVATNVNVIFKMSEHLLNIDFVCEVQKYPCLYNYTLKEYSKKDITEKAWEAVGKVVNLTALQAKEKWKNLRSVFVRNLKPQPKGSSKKKKYYLTDAMQFVIPYIKIAGTQSSLPYPEEQGEEDIEPHDPLSPTSTSPRSSSPVSDLSRRSSSDSSKQNYRRKKKKISETDELLNEFMKSKKTKKKDEENSTIKNANKMFLLSLLPDLNCMTPTQTRIFKRQVIDLMDNILSEPANSTTHIVTLKAEHIPSTSNASSSQTTRLEEW